MVVHQQILSNLPYCNSNKEVKVPNSLRKLTTNAYPFFIDTSTTLPIFEKNFSRSRSRTRYESPPTNTLVPPDLYQIEEKIRVKIRYNLEHNYMYDVFGYNNVQENKTRENFFYTRLCHGMRFYPKNVFFRIDLQLWQMNRQFRIKIIRVNVT